MFAKLIKRFRSNRQWRKTKKFMQARAQCPLSFSLVCNKVLMTPRWSK